MSNTFTIKDTKAEKIVKGLKSKIEEVKKDFFTIRHLTSMHELSAIEIEKKYNAILRVEDKEIEEDENKSIAKSVKLLTKGKKSRVLYEIIYGSHGLTITVGDDPYRVGIYLLKYADFACEGLKQVIFTKKCLDRIENYKIDINNGQTIGECTVFDREDKSIIGKLVAAMRGSSKA